MKLITSLPLSLLLTTLTSPMPAFAKNDIKDTGIGIPLEQNNLIEYWTPERR